MDFWSLVYESKIINLVRLRALKINLPFYSVVLLFLFFFVFAMLRSIKQLRTLLGRFIFVP